jgi:hypothetical protein
MAANALATKQTAEYAGLLKLQELKFCDILLLFPKAIVTSEPSVV